MADPLDLDNIGSDNDAGESETELDANDAGESETELDANESVDPEANSPESVDPEANSPNSVNTTEDEPSNVNVNVDVDVDVDQSLPSEEIIIDDEDIIIDMEKGVEINDEEIIPEEKVVANEKDQSEDLFNEIMKMVPEKYRTNRTFIKRSQTIVKNCMKLKRDVSHSELDPTNIFKLNLKLKSENYQPNLEKLLSLDFEDSYILPLVNDKKNLYEILNEEYASMLNGNLDELEDDSFIKSDNVQKINDAIKLRESYRKGKGRFNYSYNEEMSRLHNMLLPFTPDGSKGNLNKSLTSDTQVFRNTFSEDKLSYNKLRLEKSHYSTHTVLENDEVNIVGFIRLPKDFYNLKNIYKVPLSSVIYDKRNHMEFFRKLSTDSLHEHIKIDLEVGDSVLLNFNTKDGSVVINGVVAELDISTNSAIITPDDTSKSSPKKLKIKLEDPAVDIINTTYSERKIHSEQRTQMKVYIFGEAGDSNINDYRLTKYLHTIAPSTNNALEIIRQKSKFK